MYSSAFHIQPKSPQLPEIKVQAMALYGKPSASGVSIVCQSLQYGTQGHRQVAGSWGGGDRGRIGCYLVVAQPPVSVRSGGLGLAREGELYSPEWWGASYYRGDIG